MRRLVALVAVVGLSCLGLVSAGTAAGAKVVGANGQITFARFDPNVGDTVTFIANADGTGLRALFPGVQTGLPRWSPDGSRLAIQAGLDNPCPPCAASTIILNPDTGSYRILSPKGGRRPWRCFYLSGLTYRETARAREPRRVRPPPGRRRRRHGVTPHSDLWPRPSHGLLPSVPRSWSPRRAPRPARVRSRDAVVGRQAEPTRRGPGRDPRMMPPTRRGDGDPNQ